MKRGSNLLLISLAFLAFVSLGLPDGLLGVAWPSIRETFGLPLDTLGLLLIGLTSGYLLSSSNTGYLLSRLSLGTLLTLSSFATATALLGTAFSPFWWGLIASGFLGGLGAGAIDSALNTYVATQYSARTLNWLHACFGLGAATGPLIMGAVLTRGQPWQLGYIVVGSAMLLLAGCFAFSRRAWHTHTTQSGEAPVVHSGASSGSTLRLPVAWLGIIFFFVYTGIEAGVGQWSYSLLTEDRGVAPATASAAISIYWGGLTIGRIAFGLIAGLAPLALLLRVSLGGVVLGAALLWLGGGSWVALLGLGLLGFTLAPIFPSLIATTPARLGPTHTSNAVGFQVAAAAGGGALLPGALGLLADGLGLAVIALALFVAAVVLLLLYELLEASGTRDARPSEQQGIEEGV